MAEPIIMPKLGFDMAEGTLITWTVEVGQEITKGDVIAEIETDKATIEVETTVGGTVLSLLANPGDVVEVGAPMGYVGEPGEAPPEGAAPVPTEAITVAPADEPVADATPAPVAAAPAAPAPVSTDGVIKASPIARRLADERGINLRQIAGSGPGGRIVKQDVLNFAPGEAPAAPVAPTAPAASAHAAPSTPPIPPQATRPTMPTFTDVPEGADVEIVALSRIRARIGQRLVESKQFVPHFYVTTAIDVAAAMELRAELNASIEDKASKISVNDLIVKATALVLRQFPNLNSHYYGDKLVRHNRVNIGIAVALPDGGLINVTSYDADRTALGTMAYNHRDMIARAREGKVKPAEIEGSTFSVSNLGPFDVDHFIAIINPPEAGILAVGSAKRVPVVLDDGSLGVGMRMKATISVDHRVSDGVETAQFMQTLKTLLEHPMRLLI
ncbi:MAG: 2-oxo acid dehydrogenase subunit E2 [Anaerolineae bacterium]|nr:2-oxo acid dehydrogenase subunit E2 [Anaerolineae bacterium]